MWEYFTITTVFFERDRLAESEIEELVDFLNDWKLDGSGPDQWFIKDQQGKIIYDHWRSGKGKTLMLSGDLWSNYMNANAFINAQISKYLWENDYLKRKTEGSFFYRTSAHTGQSGWTNGYELLGGTNRFVGGFEISGNAKMGKDKKITYELNLVWNDIMDPEKYWGDQIGKTLFPGTVYNLHIYWKTQITLWPKN